MIQYTIWIKTDTIFPKKIKVIADTWRPSNLNDDMIVFIKDEVGLYWVSVKDLIAIKKEVIA
ncbi:MAG: hypothetical protein IJ167_04835 [Lachnospiraceae bacterium]|nr:hypothetical protein [Lachnospiraceae bacterium]